jgi:mercuric ion transport protein
MKLDNKGILAGIVGTSCCVLPLVLILAGLGGSFLTVFLVNYKAYLMTFAGAVLIYSWVQYRRDAKLCETQVCEIVGGRFRKWMLGANTAVVAFFFLVTYTSLGAVFAIDVNGNAVQTAEAILSATPQNQGMDQLRKLSLRVEGMT